MNHTNNKKHQKAQVFSVNKTSLMIALMLGSTSLTAWADAPVAGAVDTLTTLDTVSVVANKSPRPLQDVAGMVTVVDDVQIEKQVVSDMADLVRYQPTISVNSDRTRFGLGGFNIRGVGGNRVTVELDGVPVADGFSVGDFSRAGRNAVDPESIRRMEVLRGPASSMYGGDALGGVVIYATRAPSDWVRDGRSLGGMARLGYRAEDASWHTSVGGAFVGDRVSGLAMYSQRQGEETAAKGGRSNPADYDANHALLKFVYTRDSGHSTQLVLDQHKNHQTTNVRSLVGGPGRSASITSMHGDDHQSRHRISLLHEFGALGGLADSGELNLYHQASDTEQVTFETRKGNRRSPAPTKRVRRFDYQQDMLGAELKLDKEMHWGGLDHRLVYGLEYSETETTEQRDAVLTNLVTGASTSVVLGERFPVRDFPISTAKRLGLYLQDEVALGGDWALIPALRWSQYTLTPKADAMYREDFPNQVLATIKEQSLTPKLGLLKQVGEHGSMFFQYARGYREPPFKDVNIGYYNPIFNVRAIPNPDLVSETSHGVEWGYRYADEAWRFEAGLFDTRFRNLIEHKVNLGKDPDTGTLMFQSLNRAKARIYGGEVHAIYELGAFSDGLQGWTAQAALGITRGKDTERNQPLNSVNPMKAVMGVGYHGADDRWRVELMGTHHARKSAVDHGKRPLFVPPAHTTFDLLGHVDFSDNIRLNVGVFNLTDKRYWTWPQVQGVPASDPNIPMYAHPGRAINANLRVAF